ncbi:MFS transporter [Agaricicola taiwanensis]|uniref:MFS transporter n=1 Tax=Agaricicola taiwanensis TaxID=591372 RepID=A0A8J2YB11_9RHOB|nr:tripartite tricarboxylate transporter substrate binding protein [Agaricicola taiwanensis]GGE30855.1 MFS transporter [Agaricicola taiwanensis]
MTSGLLACGILLAPAVTMANDKFPEKEVTIVVPFTPGGVTDLNAQILAKHLAKHWGQKVSLQGMPGAGGAKGTMHVLAAPKDGYTMMMSATGQATQNPAIDSKSPYKWDDPTLVARTSLSPLVFVVKGDSPWNSLEDVVNDVKANPEKYKFGTSGRGGVGAIALSVLLGSSGVDVSKVGTVEKQGGGPLLEAVVTGETHFAAQYLAEMGDLLKSKAIKPLAVSTSERVKQLPDTPTAKEAGYENFSLIGWNGIVGPGDLPEEAVNDWAKALEALSSDADFVAETEASGAVVSFLGPKEFKSALKVEYETALDLVTKLGLRR